MTPKRITRTLKGVGSCIEQARSDYWMLDTDKIIPWGNFNPQDMVGGKVMRVYQESERGTILGLVVEELKITDYWFNHKPERQQRLIIPVCPNPEPELNGYMYAYHCHIRHPARRIA